MKDTFGKNFRVTIFGDTHTSEIGCKIIGCPKGIGISKEDIQKDLNRRRPGHSDLTSPRQELDKIEILSGIENGKTTGDEIILQVKNTDARPQDYKEIDNLFRPGHADYTYYKKFGSGKASGRETVARVMAGAIAKKFLKEKYNIECTASIDSIGKIINKNDGKIEELIRETKSQGDSIGGIIKGVIKNVPVGIGEPIFEKLDGELAKAMMSIGGVKGFEIGAGFASSEILGSENNDEFYIEKNRIRTRTNNAGGILGGISNGEDIIFRVAFKPTSTINKLQKTVTRDEEPIEFQGTGRHDPCIVLRAIPVVEAMAALVIMDNLRRR